MKKHIILSLALLSLASIVACNNTPSTPRDDEEVKEDSLFSYLAEHQNDEEYTLSINGSGQSYVSSTNYNKELTYSKNYIRFEDKLSDSTSVVTGYVNKSDGVYVFKYDENGYYLDNKTTEKEDYHKLCYSLKELKLDTYKNLTNNTYYFELSIDESGNPVKYIDYYNVAVLSSMLKIGSQIDYIKGARLTFDKKTKVLNYDIEAGMEVEGGTDFLFTYSTSIEFKESEYKVDEALNEATLVESTLDPKFEKIKKLASKGYGIPNYKMKGTSNGESVTFTGNVYVNDRYLVFDYSTEAYQAVQGYFVYRDALYYISPGDSSLSWRKAISKKEIIDYNAENNSNITALDFARIMFYQSFNILPIESTAIYQNPSYIKYNSKSNIFYADDSFDLLGFSANLDEFMFTSMMNPELRPLSLTLSYNEFGEADNENDDIISVGYVGYRKSSRKEEVSIEGSYNMFNYTNFGTTNSLMEFIFENSLPNTVN